MVPSDVSWSAGWPMAEPLRRADSVGADRLTREGPLEMLQVVDRIQGRCPGGRLQEGRTEVAGELRDLLLAIVGSVALAPSLVLKGQGYWKSTAPRTLVPVLPETLVAAQQVAVNATYRFTLKPSEYVLQAHLPAPGTVEPRVGITVRAGQTLRQDIPERVHLRP